MRTWHNKEEEADLSGAINNAIYSGWGHFGFHWITPFHNIAGMLTESAAARRASPLFVHPDQLRGNTRNLPVYEPEAIFPNPWLADGGTCATSWSGRRSPPGPRWTLRPGTARRFSGMPI